MKAADGGAPRRNVWRERNRERMVKRIRKGLRALTPGKVVLFLLLALGAALMIAPFLWMYSNSILTGSPQQIPPRWLPLPLSDISFAGYARLFSRQVPFTIFFKNSFIIAGVSTLGMVFHGTIAGYAFARFEFRMKQGFFALLMLTMMIPSQVTIIPLFRIMTVLGLINTHWAIVLPAVVGAAAPGTSAAFGVFLMRQYFLGMPKELEEAAAVDGAGPIRTFLSIMLPQAGGMVLSFGILVFVAAWNEYFLPFIMLHKLEKMPLTVAIMGGRGGVAAIAMAILPVLVFYLFCQRWIIRSVMSTGIKG